MTATDTLFRPLRIKTMELKNRIVMPPMTRSMAPAGIPGPANAAYYARRAHGEVGLIVSEGALVDRSANRIDANIPFFYGAAALAGWKGVIDAVHAEGGRMGPQLWHIGSAPSQREWAPTTPAESPSGLAVPGETYGIAMSEADIAATIAAFAQAAADAKRLGFDTVEVHGASGFLIDQFFWPGTNQRTDGYGGTTIAERGRFAVEVVTAVRAAVGPDFPIILRVSQWKQQDFAARLATTPAEMAAWLQPLVAAGVDILHCSQRRFWEPEFPEMDGEEGLNFAGWAKKLTGAVTISVGSVGLSGDFLSAFGGESSQPASLDNLLGRMNRDEFDLIAVGRALLSDPLWAMLVHRGEFDKLRGFVASDLAQLK